MGSDLPLSGWKKEKVSGGSSRPEDLRIKAATLNFEIFPPALSISFLQVCTWETEDSCITDTIACFFSPEHDRGKAHTA